MPKIKIEKILIANRGEIAVRIARTCQKLGIKTVAIYSDIDKRSPHVQIADEAYSVGAPKPSESYLNGLKIIEIAKRSGADAIHPGYGFLSENADFARSVEGENIIFIGPSTDAMKTMGEKTAARKLAKSLGIPIVPGSMDAVKDEKDGVEVAKAVGYPILLKAAGGGGGKGMRIVNSQKDFRENFRLAQSEAASAFGDNRIYIEKYLQNPRHVEIQILADSHGNVLHLGERECSIQRRHQKIVEESPSTIVDERLRSHLAQASLELIKASGYTNAGTLEFILDEDMNYYFLEMNTRLQVEHPVTELRTGLDLVAEQLSIASGEKLHYKQKDITFQGHAIECRIYAEDTLNRFMPSTGEIVHLFSPLISGLREDSGIEAGSTVTTFYDPLLSKLIVWGETRVEAIQRMTDTLQQYELFGVRNNIDLCLWIIGHEKFRKGLYSTTFLETDLDINYFSNVPAELIEISAITAVYSTALENTIIQKGGLQPLEGWVSQRAEFM